MTEADQNAEKLLFDALDALVRGDTAPWAAMFHDDGVMEFAKAPATDATAPKKIAA